MTQARDHNADYYQCPKCMMFSGDDWIQCKGACPVVSSPDYSDEAAAKYGPLIPMTEDEKRDFEIERDTKQTEDEEIPF